MSGRVLLTVTQIILAYIIVKLAIPGHKPDRLSKMPSRALPTNSRIISCATSNAYMVHPEVPAHTKKENELKNTYDTQFSLDHLNHSMQDREEDYNDIDCVNVNSSIY